MRLLIEHKVPIVITSMRAPRDLSEKIHQYGGIHFHDVTNLRHAEKAIESGVDGLVLFKSLLSDLQFPFFVQCLSSLQL